MRVLFITGRRRTGGWLAEAFAADSASAVQLVEIAGTASGVARLRDQVFDAVLVSHEPPSLDALSLLDAIRTGSSEEQPVLVLGEAAALELADLCFESGADGYICVPSTTVRTLIWSLARAMERHRLLAENRRLLQESRHRQQREHEEAANLLQQQRALLSGGAPDRSEVPSAARAEDHLPDTVVQHYRELLRAYVMMGSGNLERELGTLTDSLVAAGVAAGHVLLLHVQAVEETIRGLGSRSARHVMNRADLLILEVHMKLAEGYRKQLGQHFRPRRQRLLPGFEARSRGARIAA